MEAGQATQGSFPRQQTAEPKLGLALSGGGFRAAFFHVGVLAQLATLGLLGRVRVISTVSGGSIAGALYYLRLRERLLEPSRDPVLAKDYVDVVASVERQLFEGAKQNLRVRTLSRLGRHFRMISPMYSRTDRLGELLDEVFYSAEASTAPAPVGDSPARRIYMRDLGCTDPVGGANCPALILNATSLNSGRSWRFQVETMGEPPPREDSRIDEIDKAMRLLRPPTYHALAEHLSNFELGVAVAASAAVPGLFFPLPISRMYGDRIRVQLVDGGVHDNQGLQGLFDAECSHIIVSDAGGQMGESPHAAPWLLASLKRSSDVQYGRVRQEQLYRLFERAAVQSASEWQGDGSDDEGSQVLLHLRKGLPTKVEPWLGKDGQPGTPTGTAVPHTRFPVHPDVQRALSGIRTDLDAFSEAEAMSLMAEAYAMAGATVPRAHEVMRLSTGRVQDPHWRFQAAAELVEDPPARFLENLRLGRSRFFKLYLVDTPSLVLLLALVALAGAAVGQWFGPRIWHGLTARAPWALVAGSMLAAAGVYAAATLRGEKGPVLSWTFVVLGFVPRVMLAFPVSGLMWIYARFLNRRFLRAGELKRLSDPDLGALPHPLARPARRRWFRGIAWVLTVALLVVVVRPLNVLGAEDLRRPESSRGVVSLQIARTPERAQAIVRAWGQTGRHDARILTYHDFWFVCLYVLVVSAAVMSSAIVWRRRRSWRLAALGTGIAWGVVVGGLYDAVENGFLLRELSIADAGAQLPWWLPRATAVAATAKFALLMAAFVYVATVLLPLRGRERSHR